MASDLKQAIKQVTNKKLDALTGSDVGQGPCDNPFVRQATGAFQKASPAPAVSEHTVSETLETLRPDLTHEAKYWILHRMFLNTIHIVEMAAHETQPAGIGFYTTDLDIDPTIERTLKTAAGVREIGYTFGDVGPALLLFQLAYGDENREGKEPWDKVGKCTVNLTKRSEAEGLAVE